MDPELLLKISVQVGKLLLESGAETTRVEETVTYILKVYHVEEPSAFATPTGLFIAFDFNGISYAKSARITKNRVDLEKINYTNDLSRRCKQEEMSLQVFAHELEKVKNRKPYGLTARLFAGAGVALFFTLLSVQNMADGIAAFGIGFLVIWLSHVLDKKSINAFVRTIIISALIATYALILAHFGILEGIDSVIIGSLMILVPGVAITNAIRDTLEGDLLSGITRGVEATLIAVGLATGAGLVILTWTHFMGGI